MAGTSRSETREFDSARDRSPQPSQSIPVLRKRSWCLRPTAKRGDDVDGADAHAFVGARTPTPARFERRLAQDLSREHRARAGTRANDSQDLFAIGGSFHQAPKSNARVVPRRGLVLVNGIPIARWRRHMPTSIVRALR